MNLFKNIFTSALFFNLLLYSTVFCRISDKKKCADADCSVPISYATTLLQYYADDERLLSFPRNLKVKVFSKEAGDNPTFWEIEEEAPSKCMNYQGSHKHFLEVVYGKRGYVPKGLLRENKVLIPSSKLTHIVPTGRVDSPKQNDTNKTVEEKPHMISATPELPVSNSKGWFSTIGGVSADSVPMNSPDIKPQSTRKFQVFEGTTLYDDVVSEKPESPPTVIDDFVNENKESDKKPPLDSKTDPQDSNTSSMNIKPVNEIIDESKDPVGTEEISEKNVYEPTEKEEDLKKAVSEDEGDQPIEHTPESSSGSGFINNLVRGAGNLVSNYMSSGAGEEDTTIEELEQDELGDEEEEDEDGSAEEEEDENEKETSTTEGSSERLLYKNSEKEPPQSEGETLEAPQNITSDAPNLKNIFDKSSSSDMDSALKSEEYKILEPETIQNAVLAEENIDIEKDKELIKESNKGSTEIKTDKEEEEIIIYKQNHLQSTPGDEVKSESTQDSGLLTEQTVELQQGEPIKGDGANVFYSPSQQDKTYAQQKLTEEIKTEGEYVEKEKTSDKIEDQSTEATESQINSDSDQPKIEEQQKTDEGKFQEQLQTVEPKFHEQPEIITDSSSVAPETQEQLDTTTASPTETPAPARELLFGSNQINEVRQQHKHESTEASSLPVLHDEITQVVPINDTSKSDNLHSSDPAYSSLPSIQSIGSPKYASVISRRIQSSESTSVNEILSHSEEEEEEETGQQPNHTTDTSESTDLHEDTVSADLSTQSPKYSSVVSRQIGYFTPEGQTPNEAPLMKPDFAEPADSSTMKEESGDIYQTEMLSQADVKPKEETESEEETVVETHEVPLQHSQPPTPGDVESPGDVVSETSTDLTSEGGMVSWFSSLFDVFASTDSSSTETEKELPAKIETLDPSKISHITEETCSADGIEGSCPTLGDAMQKEVTWQEFSYTSDMWELMDRVPMEATIWLIITAVVVLIFSLGHYYIEAHRRDGPLVAIINKLEREVLILKKESCIMEDCLQVAQQQVEAWNTSSSENDALVVELKQELEETKAAKAELEEQAAQLKEELETVTESGLEMHRLLEESLSSQDGSQVLLSTVETLREKLQHQEDEISGLSHTLSSKNAEVEELQGKLTQAAEVARSLEDKVIAVTREKEEEAHQLRDKHRQLISQLEEMMETKALEETRLSTEMSKLRLNIKELQKTLAEKDSELETLKEVVKQLRSTDSNEKIEALFDVVGVQAKLKTAVAERDDFREKFLEEEGARKLLEGHMKKITQEVADLKNNFETAEREKIEALTKLQVLSNYFKEKESQLQKELGLQESMWLQKQSDDHTIYEQMRSLREENEKYKLQNESLKKEIVEQEASFKIQLANTEQKAHENWVASRQAERRLKEAQQESAQLRNRLTLVEKNSANYSLDEKQINSESNGDPSSPPPSLMFPSTTSPPFMMYGPPMPPGDYVPPPPLMGSPYPSDSRPPPVGRISSPPLDHRFSPPPPLSYPHYDYSPYGHHSPSPPPPMPPHHRNVHKPQPRELLSREQKDHVPNYSPEAEKTTRRNKR